MRKLLIFLMISVLLSVLAVSCDEAKDITLNDGDDLTGDTSGNSNQDSNENNEDIINDTTNDDESDDGDNGGGTTPVPDPIVYFVTLSDYGDKSEEQQAVADAIKAYCSTENCQFVLTLGDNFQGENGVSGLDDPQWDTVFKDVYGDLGLMFYVTLGNHDMNGNFQSEIEYSSIDSQWYLPSQYYTFKMPSIDPIAQFFVISSGDYEYEDEEEAWLEGALSSGINGWRFLVSHQPFISNGDEHGDLDMYKGDDLIADACGNVDFVLSGHDHVFSYLTEEKTECTIKQFVIGTGGSDLYDFNADPRAEVSASINGFGWFKVEKSQVTFRFIDVDGNEYFEKVWTK